MSLQSRIQTFVVPEADFASLAGLPDGDYHLSVAERLGIRIQGVQTPEGDRQLVQSLEVGETLSPEGWTIFHFEVLLHHGCSPDVAETVIAAAIEDFCNPRTRRDIVPTELGSMR